MSLVDFFKGENMSNVQLSNLQLELLKLYSTNVEEDDLNDVKILLASYFSKKAISEADKVWESKKLSNKDMDKWLNEK
jgi:hypothetical protein